MFLPAIPQMPQYEYVKSADVSDHNSIIRQVSDFDSFRNQIMLDELSRYRLIKESFYFHGGKDVPKQVAQSMESIAQEFRKVAFKRVVAEYSPVMEMIQFSMFFSNGMRVSFGKPADENDSDDVFFSLMVDNDVLLVDRKRVEDLKNVLLETIHN